MSNNSSFLFFHSFIVFSYSAQLQDPIQFSANEAPVKLASSPSQTGTRCVVSGWGRISTEGLGSQTLLKLNTVIVNKGSCTAAINLPLLNTHICAFNSRETGICLVSVYIDIYSFESALKR